MYGMLLESVQHFVATKYGEEAWAQILTSVNARNLLFTTHRRYKDSLLLDLAEACSKVLNEGTKDDFLCYFGKCFVKFWTHYGYDKIMRVAGRSYRDFLHGIDNLHETMRFSFPKMISPSFYVENEDTNGCYLHYRSKRIGFTYYVIGQLKQCGKKFYNQDVEVTVVQEQITEKGCHVTYRLNFDNSAFQLREPSKTYPAIKDFPTIPSTVFFKVSTYFPYFRNSELH